MSTPIRITTAAALALLLVSFTQAHAAPPQDSSSTASWKPLFDGRSLDGWEHVGPGRLCIEDGVLRTQGGMGLLWYTREKLGNCTIRMVYKTAPKISNSGVYIRIAEQPKDQWYRGPPRLRGANQEYGPDARRTGSIYAFAKAWPAVQEPESGTPWRSRSRPTRSPPPSTA